MMGVGRQDSVVGYRRNREGWRSGVVVVAAALGGGVVAAMVIGRGGAGMGELGGGIWAVGRVKKCIRFAQKSSRFCLQRKRRMGTINLLSGSGVLRRAARAV